MHALTLYRHTMKSLTRFPLMLALRYDYYTRWLPQTYPINASWQQYLKVLRSNMHRRRRQERLTREKKLVDDANNDLVVTKMWPSAGDEYTPYVCPKCLAVDTGCLFVFETVQPRRKDGGVSRLYHLSYRCTQCSTREFVHKNSFRILPPRESLSDMTPQWRNAYSLSYEVCHGSACYARRQTRDRVTDEVTWVGVKPGRLRMRPEVRVNNPLISNLTVDEVTIPKDHPLFHRLMYLALASERSHE